MKIGIPDFAPDGHTVTGRRMGRSDANAYDASYLLENCTLPDPYEEEARAIDGAPRVASL